MGQLNGSDFGRLQSIGIFHPHGCAVWKGSVNPKIKVWHLRFLKRNHIPPEEKARSGKR